MHYLVAGLARTGTTALFTALRQALPPGTRTFFEPRSEEEFEEILSYAGPDHTLTKALIGFITSDSKFARHFKPNILIVRDPRDQIVSELLYRFYDFKVHNDLGGYEEGSALLAQKVSNPNSIATTDLFNQIGLLVGRPGMELLRRKYEWVLEYREAFRPYVVRYKSFVDGINADFESFLGFELSSQLEVDAEFSRVARTKSHGGWKDWLTEQDLTFVNEQVGGIMKELGYSLVTKASLPDRLPRETTLDYVGQFSP